MALSSSTFSLGGGAVSDLFAGFAAPIKYGMQATGYQLQAQGLRIKSAGDIAEGKEYDLAGALARQNEEYVRQSTAIQQCSLIGRSRSRSAGSART
jgi:hypothetical protein